MSLCNRRRTQRGILGLAMAALAFGIGATALGGSYLLGRLALSKQQALQATDQQLRQGGSWSQTRQDQAREANRDLNQLMASGGGGRVVTGVLDEGPPATSLSGLVAAASTGALVERAAAAAPAATQSVALPPDALKIAPCAAATLAFCETRSSCTSAGGHWWADSTCNRQPQPACTATQLSYCFDESSCEAAQGDWLDGECTRNWCWQFVQTRRVETPLSRGYAGGATTVHGLISLDSHPSDPNWSHLITAVSFRWSFDRADPVNGHPMTFCPGDPIGGTASMSNTGNQFGPAGYVPNAYMAMYVNRSPAWAPVWRLSSAELPPPGQTVTRPFSLPAPGYSARGDTLSIVAAGYAGRENTYTYEFRLVSHGSFPAAASPVRAAVRSGTGIATPTAAAAPGP